MGYYLGVAVFVGLVLIVGSGEAKQNITSNKCDIPPSAPKRIEEAINSCQDEIKIAILSEALHALNVNDHHPKNRAKRATFSADEKRIAGCLLQCVYRKMKAVDEDGFPTIEGLVKVYTEGISQKDYVLATVQAVDKCLTNAKKAHLDSPESLEDQKNPATSHTTSSTVSPMKLENTVAIPSEQFLHLKKHTDVQQNIVK